MCKQCFSSTEIAIIVISTEGRNLGACDMNNLRFLTYVRNESLFYCDKVSGRRGREGANTQHFSVFLIISSRFQFTSSLTLHLSVLVL
jgi:hypothetical protein